MDCDDLRALVVDEITDGWSCAIGPRGDLFLSAPFTYADGDHPELIVSEAEGGRVIVTDFGSALDRLRLAGVNPHRGKAGDAVSALARAYGFRVRDGELRMDVPTTSAARAVVDLAAAMLQLEALRVLAGATPPRPFRDTLRRYLRESLPTVDLEQRLTGSSGAVYPIDAVVPTGAGLVYVQAISDAQSTVDARIDRVYRVWTDVNGDVATRAKVSVLAGKPSKYDRTDIKLLERVSIVGAWDERDMIVNYLTAPAPLRTNRLYTAMDSIPGV